MPSTAVRTVGVYFYPNFKFYVMGGRSMDGVGNDLTHPFEFTPGTINTWSIKSATYPDNQVSNMACGVLTDSGTNYIYCVGGSADGQSTATAATVLFAELGSVGGESSLNLRGANAAFNASKENGGTLCTSLLHNCFRHVFAPHALSLSRATYPPA